jgi:hypothetical protein
LVGTIQSHPKWLATKGKHQDNDIGLNPGCPYRANYRAGVWPDVVSGCGFGLYLSISSFN